MTAAIAASALAATAAPAERAGWQRTDLRPVSQPVSSGGHVLLYAGGGGGLQLVALDPKTGKTVWTRPATPSAAASGVAPQLVGDDTAVVYLAKSGNLARVAALDSRSGKVLWGTTAGVVPVVAAALP